ncbi:IS3 family transposase [Streptomyces sp. SM11]|uniref:IS3 family transposase n=1 Tax=Streptomyces sp. SM11 TaxID=565557 RepID=UPI0015E184DA|nr:IS3 family transposase [Streptomyces sp. SM11]
MTENAPEAVVAFIGSQRVEHGVPHRVSCRVVGVSEAWFYKWRRRPGEPTKREVRRARLEERIIHFFTESGGTYGSPRITSDLWAENWKVSVNTVAEIMAELGLQGRKPPPRRRSLTRQGKRKAAPDLVNRRFDAVAPDVLRYGDMTGSRPVRARSVWPRSSMRSRAAASATPWASTMTRPWSGRR